jgi:DNA repair protein RadC
MSNHNLFTLSADGAMAPASSEAILQAARQVLAHRVRRGASLGSPQKTGEYLTTRLGCLDYEVSDSSCSIYVKRDLMWTCRATAGETQR